MTGGFREEIKTQTHTGKEHQGLSRKHQKLEQITKDPWERAKACQQLDFRCLDPRTERINFC